MEKIDTKPTGSEIHLQDFQIEYEAHCPKKASTIAAKLVGHFLPYLVISRLPMVTLIDGDQLIDIGDFYAQNQKKSDLDIVQHRFDLTDEPREFQIHHVLLKKQLKFLESGLHWMFYAGNDRVVKEDSIDGQLGLKYIGEESDCVYVGLVTSPYLDAHVNQERTGFTFGSEILTEIHKSVIAATKNFLSAEIGKIRAFQIETASTLINKNPQFLPFKEAIQEFVEKNLSLNTQSEEDIFLELSRRKLRIRKRLEGEIAQLTSSGSNSDIEKTVAQITDALNIEKKSSLAEYVVRRKEILELLSSSLAFQSPQNPKYYREDVIHNLICPVRSSSEELSYDEHNLWILDDRLAFYSFFQSDKPFNTFLADTASGKEPDLAIVFDRSLAFQREGKDEPVIIIEFKRPGRDDFTGNTNPVAQVLEYVDIFRAGKSVTTASGRIIKPISPSTRFICFVIADFTDSLVKVVRTTVASHRSADGLGYFGYSSEHNAFVEVTPYDKVLRDAQIRNEAFFSRLGLV